VAEWPLQLHSRVFVNGGLAVEGVLVSISRHLQRSVGFWTYRMAGLAPHVGGAPAHARCCRCPCPWAAPAACR
jgi:hypothetical protein